jgi:hypothetical protein
MKFYVDLSDYRKLKKDLIAGGYVEYDKDQIKDIEADDMIYAFHLLSSNSMMVWSGEVKAVFE